MVAESATDLQFDVVVVGGGPAGITAARTVRRAGLGVALVDERPALGGQIYKQPGPGFAVTQPRAMDRQYRAGRSLIDSLDATGVAVVLGTCVVAVEGRTLVLHSEGSPVRRVTARGLILAPGAHDRPVPFPGWTLPGVMTAGGLQTIAKTQRFLPGARVFFAGSGPVALAFPGQLAHYGARIVCATDAGPAPNAADIARIARVARGNGVMLRDAIHYRALLVRHGIRRRYRRIVVRADGDGRVEQVVHAAVDADWRVLAGTEETVSADVLCVGYGFVPSVELLRLVGCQFQYDENLGGRVVVRDEWLRTTVEGVYAAGDGAGVEGSFVAIEEGTIAGLAAALDLGALSLGEATAAARPPRARLAHRRALAAATSRMFATGSGLYELATAETVICRCESVRRDDLLRAVESSSDISAVKAATRAGMGPCQGRNCQGHIAALIARRHHLRLADVRLATPRMPVRPVPIRDMADASIEGPTLFLRPEVGTPVATSAPTAPPA